MSRAFWLYVPNMITLGRILCVPIMIWMVLSHNLAVAFWVFIIAGISDAVDGYLAKVLKARTKVGAFLDPIADKFLLVSAFVVLGVQDFLPLWLVIMVVFRDLAIVVGAALIELLTHDLKMEPSLSSKLNTFVQVVLAGTVLAQHGLNLASMDHVITGLIYLTAISATVSGAIYLYYWAKNISQPNEEESI